MTDLYAGIKIKKDYLGDCYEICDNKYGFTLDENRAEIEYLLENNYENIYNKKSNDGFPIYEHSRKAVEGFAQYKYGKSFQNLLDELLSVDSDKYYFTIY